MPGTQLTVSTEYFEEQHNLWPGEHQKKMFLSQLFPETI